MGLFDWLFGRKSATPSPPAAPPTGLSEFDRAVELQRAYWTYNPDEHAQLEREGVDALEWSRLLRLHHLACLRRLRAGPDRLAVSEVWSSAIRRLLSDDSPYRPRVAMIWQGRTGGADGSREPDMQGQFLNPSLTHLACLEVYRVDGANRPIALNFVGFDELSGVGFASPSMIRAAKLFYDDGRGEIVLVPLLYGLTWEIGNEYDRDGRMTRFVSHLSDTPLDAFGASGFGVGQQDFSVRRDDGSCTLFGLGSVAEISFPLDMSDPNFDRKARARGIDPDEVRRRMG